MTHTTKYGNQYTDQEWQGMQASFKVQEKVDNAIETKINGMIKFLVRQCVEFGFGDEQAQLIARLFRSGDWLEANIQFSSKENQIFVEDMWVRFDKVMSKLS